MNIYSKACIVASIVGSILLVINQFDALFGQASLKLIPALLTYCVPFIVFLLGNYNTSNKTNSEKEDFTC